MNNCFVRSEASELMSIKRSILYNGQIFSFWTLEVTFWLSKMFGELMPDPPLGGDVVEEEQEWGGGEDRHHGGVAVHVNRVSFGVVASSFHIKVKYQLSYAHFEIRSKAVWCFLVP